MYTQDINTQPQLDIEDQIYSVAKAHALQQAQLHAEEKAKSLKKAVAAAVMLLLLTAERLVRSFSFRQIASMTDMSSRKVNFDSDVTLRKFCQSS
jgi:hypothetical protein